MTATPRLALPFLSAGQAQKEFYHNEALQTLDFVTAPAVEDGPISTPPASLSVGECYIVDASPTDAWAANPQALAAYTSGGWRFLAPFEGLSVYVKAAAVWANFCSGTWELGTVRGSSLVLDGQQVVAARAAAIASPSGGTTVDAEGRTAIDAILAALRQHGLIES
jgi:uncharacterized protein DUF2793